MYVKGVQTGKISSSESVEDLTNHTTTLDCAETKNEHPNELAEPPLSLGEGTITESEVWNSHADQVLVSTSPVHSKCSIKIKMRLKYLCKIWLRMFKSGDDDEHIGGNSSSSDADEEWVPSCWDSMAQPARSALKSPDKTSSVSI